MTTKDLLIEKIKEGQLAPNKQEFIADLKKVCKPIKSSPKPTKT